MLPQSRPRAVLSDAEFRVHWIAGLSAAAIAQMASCTPQDVLARAQYLGFVLSPLKTNAP